MTKIGLVVKAGIEPAEELGKELLKWAKKNGHSVVLETATARILRAGKGGVPSTKLAVTANPIVTLGGDGTLIGVARYSSEDPPVMLGVNFGHLGFLTEIQPSELFSTLSAVLAGKAEYGMRNMLLAELFRDGRKVFSSQAVNDAVVQKGVRDRLLDLDLSVDDEDVMRLRADGLIVGTPTGSTAYSLAAGGSIVLPTLSVLLVTPICPHSLTHRPLILGGDSIVTVRVPAYEGKVFLSIDGQVSTEVQQGDKIRVTKSNHFVCFVRSPKRSYFEILRNKLNWGIGNKSD